MSAFRSEADIHRAPLPIRFALQPLRRCAVASNVKLH
jgi:hypothetical protein